MQKIDGKLSAKIANLAWVCALWIVFFHTGVIGTPQTFAAALLNNILVGGLFSMSVPFFFLAPGWLLAAHLDEPNWWGQALKRRLHTLLVPFLILALGAFCASSAIHLANAYRATGSLAGVFTPLGVLSSFGLNPFDFPGHNILWYLRILMLLVLASPLLVWCLRRLGIVFVLGVFVLLCIVTPWSFTGDPESPWRILVKATLNDRALFFFTLGLYLRLKKTPLPSPWSFALVGLAGGIALWVCRFFVPGIPPGLNMVLYQLQAICLLTFFLRVMPPVRLPFAWSAYPLFAFHTYFTCMGQFLGFPPAASTVESFLGQTLLAAGGSYFLASLLKKLSPRALHILFGARADTPPPTA